MIPFILHIYSKHTPVRTRFTHHFAHNYEWTCKAHSCCSVSVPNAFSITKVTTGFPLRGGGESQADLNSGNPVVTSVDRAVLDFPIVHQSTASTPRASPLVRLVRRACCRLACAVGDDVVTEVARVCRVSDSALPARSLFPPLSDEEASVGLTEDGEGLGGWVVENHVRLYEKTISPQIIERSQFWAAGLDVSPIQKWGSFEHIWWKYCWGLCGLSFIRVWRGRARTNAKEGLWWGAPPTLLSKRRKLKHQGTSQEASESVSLHQSLPSRSQCRTKAWWSCTGPNPPAEQNRILCQLPHRSSHCHTC